MPITIDLGEIEFYDSVNNEFIPRKGGVVSFEYSLKALFEWEGKWKKPYLKGGLTNEELVDFYKTMALQPIDSDFITNDVMQILADYIRDTRTATTFTNDGSETNSKPKNYTSEELYAIMFNSGIALEFENCNLNRLLVIIRIIASYNSPPKKMPKQEILKQNASLNAQRKAMLNTKG